MVVFLVCERDSRVSGGAREPETEPQRPLDGNRVEERERLQAIVFSHTRTPWETIHNDQTEVNAEDASHF